MSELGRRERACLPVAALAVALATMVVGHGCAGPPWYLGEPLGGKPAIPPSSQARTVAEHRADATAARARGDRVAEIASLDALEKRSALHPEEEKRFVELLAQRARDWAALGRPLPLTEDLRHIIALAPARALPLAPRLRNAERVAGDLWLGLGETGRAEAEYRAAEKLGAGGMDYRFRAVWGVSIADLDDGPLGQALAQLPERALAPFSKEYLDRAGADPRLLRRAWSAARIYGPPALRARLQALPEAAAFSAEAAVSLATERDALTGGVAARIPEPGPDDLLSTGPTLARALLPAAAAFPQLLAPGPRSRLWAQRLLAEDPTSPDSQELAALIDARAGRLGGAEQRLADMVFFSVDRAAGYERAARVWSQVGDTRRECWAWDHATRVGPIDDPRWCRLLACARRDPGAADPIAVVAHLRDQAPALACDSTGQPPPPQEEAPPAAFPPDASVPDQRP